MNSHITWVGQNARKTNAKIMASIAGEAIARPIGRPTKRKMPTHRSALGHKNTQYTKNIILRGDRRGLIENISGHKTGTPGKEVGIQTDLE